MRKLYKWLCKAEEAACSAGLVFLVIFIFMSAVMRAFKISQSWYIDLSMLLLAWTSFLGADVAWRKGQILGVDLVTRKLPAKLQRIIELSIYAIIFVTLIVIVIFGIRLSWTERVATFQSMPIPYSLVTMSLVVASLSMTVTTLQKIVRTVRALGNKEKQS